MTSKLYPVKKSMGCTLPDVSCQSYTKGRIPMVQIHAATRAHALTGLSTTNTLVPYAWQNLPSTNPVIDRSGLADRWVHIKSVNICCHIDAASSSLYLCRPSDMCWLIDSTEPSTVPSARQNQVMAEALFRSLEIRFADILQKTL
jgi:hypothetical protein